MSHSRNTPVIKGRRPARKQRRISHRRDRRQSRHELMWEVLMGDYERVLDLQFGEAK